MVVSYGAPIGRVNTVVNMLKAVCQFRVVIYTQQGSMKIRVHFFNPSLAESDMPCLSKQCRSRSVGF